MQIWFDNSVYELLDDNDNSGQPVLQGVDDDGGRSGGMNSSTAGLGSPRGEDEGVEKGMLNDFLSTT